VLLRALLRPPLPLTEHVVAEKHPRAEPPRVVRPGALDVVAGRGEPEACRELLEAVLEVSPARLLGDLRDPPAEALEDELARRLDAPREVHGADHGLEGVGEDRGLRPTPRRILASPEQDGLGNAELDRERGERGRAHDGGPDAGEVPLGQLGEGAVEVGGDDDAEDGVAEELEPLVRRLPRVLRAPRPVRERLAEQTAVVEVGCEARRKGLEPAPASSPTARQAASSFAVT